MGNYAGAFAPLKHAIRRLEQIRVQSQGRVHELVRFAILIKAWNAYVEGKRGSLTMIGVRSVFSVNTAFAPGMSQP